MWLEDRLRYDAETTRIASVRFDAVSREFQSSDWGICYLRIYDLIVKREIPATDDELVRHLVMFLWSHNAREKRADHLCGMVGKSTHAMSSVFSHNRSRERYNYRRTRMRKRHTKQVREKQAVMRRAFRLRVEERFHVIQPLHELCHKEDVSAAVELCSRMKEFELLRLRIQHDGKTVERCLNCDQSFIDKSVKNMRRRVRRRVSN